MPKANNFHNGNRAARTSGKMKGSNMRELNDHKVNPVNDVISITVADEPGAGGANHKYVIGGYDGAPVIDFQNGSINEAGVNGVTHEALLAIVADRMRSFQSGPYSCRENALALTKVEEALQWMHKRTLDRMRRSVEGTSQL